MWFGTKLNDFATEKWKTSVLSKPKLRTYKLFKTDLAAEPHINCCMSRFKRSIFAKFRCGILPLQLERIWDNFDYIRILGVHLVLYQSLTCYLNIALCQ